MRTRDFVLLAYRAFGGKMSGKTLLQKRVYFLGVQLKQVKELGYGAHYYGPYSSEVADANTQLKSLGFLEETVVGGGAVGSGGFEIARHDFKLSEAGHRIAKFLANEFPQEWQEISKIAGVIQQAGDLDYMELSWAAKAYFLLRERGGRATLSEIKQTASLFSWELTDEQVEKATSFLEKTGFITKA